MTLRYIHYFFFLSIILGLNLARYAKKTKGTGARAVTSIGPQMI